MKIKYKINGFLTLLKDGLKFIYKFLNNLNKIIIKNQILIASFQIIVFYLNKKRT
jgi:hypothetical protein